MSNAIVKGSISDVMRLENSTIEEAMMNVKAVVGADASASMGARDAGEGGALTRWEARDYELEKLQAMMPGAIMLYGFSNKTVQFLNGRIDNNTPGMGGMTDMADCIRTAFLPWKGAGVQFFLISDGEPNYGTEEETISLAGQLGEPIHCIFVGEAGSKGEDFMKRLGSLTGGSSQTDQAIKKLAKNISTLLLSDGKSSGGAIQL